MRTISIDALRRHYLRAAWVLAYWKESKKEYMEPPPITLYGWKEADGKIQVDWASETNIKTVRNRVTFLTRGCGCQKTKCSNKQCSCYKNNRQCGPGCSCVNCYNHEQSKTHMCGQTFYVR